MTASAQQRLDASYPVWGWGDAAPRLTDLAGLRPALRELLGFDGQEPEVPAPVGGPDEVDRARHSLGRSYSDLLRGLRGQLPRLVDRVERPASEDEVAALLEAAAGAGAAVVPFGGGTSVTGGVTPLGLDDRPVWSLDLGRLAGVAEVDRTSRAARVRAGTTGPALEDALRPQGLTARFYPQSFQRSTVGGWVATRAGGHYATRLQHVDDLVEGVRAVTPAGVWESRRLPGSGAGPSPDRLLLGSEGVLGVVTEAWLRLQDRPAARASTTLLAPTFLAGAEAVRALVQSGRAPDTLRLVDGREAAATGALPAGADPAEALVVVGAEHAEDQPLVDAALAAAVAVLEAHGCREPEGARRAGGSWRSSFTSAPLLRDSLVLLGVLSETFETACTWDQLPALHADVTAATEAALQEVCGGGRVTCRLTHVYPDGAAPYFTVLAPARRGDELAQWAAVKRAASDALLAAGGTITHHHAVGRDHRPWYDAQRPDPFALALAAAKAAVDPAGVLNPGVLLGPAPSPASPATRATARSA